MATIGLIVRDQVPQAVVLACEVIDWAIGAGHSILLDAHVGSLVKRKVPLAPAHELAVSSDPIVTLGGDGTLLGIARFVGQPSPSVVGVNFGNLGFLTEIAPSEVISTLEAYFDGRTRSAVRSMITASVTRNNEVVFENQALNDVVIQKGSTDPLIELDIHVDGEPVVTARADGIILSTPTGSTAYSLAAGGSIAFPTLSVTLLTPICPHSLTVRPLLLPMDSRISIRVPSSAGNVFLSVDGQVSTGLQHGDEVTVVRSPHTVRLVRSSSRSYFEILRAKLNWGIGNRGGGENAR